MKNIKLKIKSLYLHPVLRYILVGGSTFALDFSFLVVFKQGLGLGLALSTSIAYWLAVAYNFSLNRNWTFSAIEKESLKKHLVSYLVLLGFNYLFTVLFVSIVGRHIYFGAAKAAAVIIQTSWTYLIYKNKIFVKQEPAVSSKN